MNRIQPVDPARATGKAKEQLQAVQHKLGTVPNLMRVLAHAPAALEGYLQLSSALAGGSLNAKVREQIALTVAEANQCEYCLSAHTFIGGKLGLTPDELASARQATAAAPETKAILELARALVVERGELSDAELQRARAAGLTDARIVEVLANVALNLFTNYVNHVAQTVVDFPKVATPVPAGQGCGTGACER